MRKHTTIDLDLGLVREAAAMLGTTRTTDTVHAALAEVVARRRRAALARMDLPDLTPEALDEMRATRMIADRPGRSARRTRPVTAAER
ncbi:MAG: type II toxin-antitoxin system VapB family antitoxin [Candidatus Limnocylindrales bacterium]